MTINERFWQWVTSHGMLVLKIVLGVETVALIAILALLFSLDEDNGRLRQNQAHAGIGFGTRLTDDGRSVAEVTALTMKVSELEAGRDSLLRTVESLGVSNRRLLALAQTATQTSAGVRTPVRDSIVYLPGKADTLPGRVDTLRCLRWADPWLTIDGCIRKDTFEGSVVSRDTLDIVAHRVPKRFLFFRYGCRAVRLDVAGHSPHTTVTAARYIRLQK